MSSATPEYEWKTLPWQQLERAVFKLQKRIFRASQRGDRKTGSYEVLIDSVAIAQATKPTNVPNMWIVPASTDLAGAEIDYREGLDGAQFVIRNPNAQTTCGCGSSFTA